MANAARHDQPAPLQFRQFALRRSRSRACVPNQLRCVKTPLRLAEKHTEDALLCLGQQSICQAFAARSTRAMLHTQYGYHHALFGYERQREGGQGDSSTSLQENPKELMV